MRTRTAAEHSLLGIPFVNRYLALHVAAGEVLAPGCSLILHALPSPFEQVGGAFRDLHASVSPRTPGVWK